jgi:glycosyltransferase involved in cell wall biosynthesis
MKISVLTPSYNSGQYIERAIQSVLQQKVDFEHIIMDGGSTDKSLEVLKKYPHLIWESAPDKGQSDAMNKAFARSSGDIIVYLNADDFFKQGVFSKVLDFFKNNQNLDMLVGNLEVVDSLTNATHIHCPSILFEDVLIFPKYRFPLNPVSYFYKKELQNKIGDFPVKNHYTMDYWFLLNAYKLGRVEAINLTMGTFWFSKDNKSADPWLSYERLFDTCMEFVHSNPELDKAQYLKEVFMQLVNDLKRTREGFDAVVNSKVWQISTKVNSILRRK